MGVRGPGRSCLGVFILGLLAACPASAEVRRPNVLLIVVDDIGWGEFGFQGEGRIPTTNIDSIAAEGVRFVQAYATAPLCAPSRAALLTGRYQTRFGFEVHGTQHVAGIPPWQPTLAELLGGRGYETMAIGKWDVGDGVGFLPTEKGFDAFYGTVNNTSYFFPERFVDTRISPVPGTVTDPGFYSTLDYAGRAARWIGERGESPWFLYVAFNAAHAPLEAPQAYLERFASIRDPRRRTYAAVTSALDDAVGEILRSLRASGRERDTLVALISDNGGVTWQTTSGNGGLRGNKATLYEGGIRVPFCMRWPAALPAGATFVPPVASIDIAPTALRAAGVPAEEIGPIDGVDLLPYLRGEAPGPPHAALYWKMGRQWGIRVGDWKLVKSDTTRVERDRLGRPLGVPTPGANRPELFNLATDVGERRDLLRRLRPLGGMLQAAWSAWASGNPPPLLPPGRNGQ